MKKVFIFLLLIINFSFAKELEDLIDLALKNSPKVKQFDHKIKIYSLKENSSKSLPNPTFYFGLSNIPTSKLFVTQQEPMSSFLVGFSQRYTFPFKRELESSIYKSESKVSETEREILKREIIRDIKTNYYQWLFTFKKEEILKSIIKDLENLIVFAETNYKYGKANLSDILSLKTEHINIQKDLISLYNERKNIEEDIFNLVGKKVEFKQEDIKYQFEEKYDFSKSPYLEKLIKEKETLENVKKKTAVEYFPDIEFMAEYMFRPAISNLFSLKVGIDIPIWKKSKEDLLVLESQENIREKEKEINSLYLEIQKKVNQLKNNINTTKQLLRFTDEILKNKENEIKSVELNYKYGKSEFKDLVNIYKDIWEVKLFKVDYEISLIKFYVELESIL